MMKKLIILGVLALLLAACDGLETSAYDEIKAQELPLSLFTLEDEEIHIEVASYYGFILPADEWQVECPPAIEIISEITLPRSPDSPEMDTYITFILQDSGQYELAFTKGEERVEILLESN